VRLAVSGTEREDPGPETFHAVMEPDGPQPGSSKSTTTSLPPAVAVPATANATPGGPALLELMSAARGGEASPAYPGQTGWFCARLDKL